MFAHTDKSDLGDSGRAKRTDLITQCRRTARPHPHAFGVAPSPVPGGEEQYRLRCDGGAICLKYSDGAETDKSEFESVF